VFPAGGQERRPGVSPILTPPSPVGGLLLVADLSHDASTRRRVQRGFDFYQHQKFFEAA
jgi:hypothetical protein